MMDEKLTGISLRRALNIARELGCEVVQPHRSGELFVRHPLRGSKPVVINARRKDSSHVLNALLRRLREQMLAVAGNPLEVAVETDADVIAEDRTNTESIMMIEKVDAEAMDEVGTEPDSDAALQSNNEPEADGREVQPRVLTQRWQEFLALRNTLVGETRERLEELRRDRQALMEMLADTDQQIQSLQQEVAGVGLRALVDVADPMSNTPVRAASSDTPISVSLRGRQAALAEQILSFLRDRRGTWCGASYVKQSVGRDTQFPLACGKLVALGMIERRGAKRGTEYRIIESAAVGTHSS